MAAAAGLAGALARCRMVAAAPPASATMRRQDWLAHSLPLVCGRLGLCGEQVAAALKNSSQVLLLLFLLLLLLLGAFQVSCRAYHPCVSTSS